MNSALNLRGGSTRKFFKFGVGIHLQGSLEIVLVSSLLFLSGCAVIRELKLCVQTQYEKRQANKKVTKMQRAITNFVVLKLHCLTKVMAQERKSKTYK